jgi:C_GCAxxG_C_C family probable redox protein
LFYFSKNKKERFSMTRKEKMNALRASTEVHYNCAQSVLVPFAQDMGLTEEQANALTLNFGAGMGCGGVCGAVAGALMALGGLGLPQEKRGELTRKFVGENGCLNCPELLKAAAERGEEKKAHCDRLVAQCLDFVCQETGLE